MKPTTRRSTKLTIKELEGRIETLRSRCVWFGVMLGILVFFLYIYYFYPLENEVHSKQIQIDYLNAKFQQMDLAKVEVCDETKMCMCDYNTTLGWIEYGVWKESTGFNGDKSECFECYCE